MNKKLRSMLTMVMCLALVAVMLAGCFQQKTEDTSANKPIPTTPAETTPDPTIPVKPAEFKKADGISHTAP